MKMQDTTVATPTTALAPVPNEKKQNIIAAVAETSRL